MTNPNWGLLSPAAIGNSVTDGFERGIAIGQKLRAAEQERELQAALSTFAANPDDPSALQEVMRRNPELGIKLAGYADQRAFNAAMGDYLAPGGQPNALLAISGQQTGAQSPRAGFAGPVPSGASQAPMNALAAVAAPPAQQGQDFASAFAPFSQPAAPQPNLQEPQPASQPEMQQPDLSSLDLSFLGEPQSGRDRAFLAMVKRDPIKALKIQSALRDNFMDQLEAEREFYGIGIDEISRASDQASWSAALSRLAPYAEAMDINLLDHVPEAYPGPEAVQELMERALPIKERLDYLLREANMEADNARADRNTNSMIQTREERLEEQRRYNSGRLSNQRRGQDLTDARGRRGQDMTDARARSRGSSSRSSDSGGGSSSRPTATDAQGNKVEWNGKKWVPAN